MMPPCRSSKAPSGSRMLTLVSVILATVFVFSMTFPAIVEAQTCCTGMTGNVDCSPDGNVDIADLTALIDYLFVSLNPLCCFDAADCDLDSAHNVDIADLTAIINYLFVDLSPLPPCAAGNLLDPSVRMAAIDLVKVKAKSLDWSNLNTANGQLSAYINTLPEFDTAAVNSEVANVWALFTDGVLLMYINNRGPATGATDGSPGASDDSPSDQNFGAAQQEQSSRTVPSGGSAGGDELPLSVQARTVETLGSHFAPATAVVRTMLTSNGYLAAPSTSGTVNGLKLVGGDGVLYYDAHGGAGYFNGNGTDSTFGLWTSSLATAANLPSYSVDFAARRICVMVGAVGVAGDGKDSIEAHYGITSRFVSWYWHDFGQNAVVFIDACGGGGTFATGLRNAMFAKKASVYFGWSKPVYSDAASLVAKFMFDRLMGANVASPKENPPQRPFGRTDIYGDLVNRGLTVHPSTDGSTTTFVAFSGPGSFGILAPSISFMSVDEQLEILTINGIFGPDPTEDGQVMVNGTKLAVIVWTQNEIQCVLPRAGGGSEGPVTVEVRGDYGGTTPLTFRKSNVVNLSSWHIPFHYEHHEGNAVIVADMNLHLRGDIHAHREVIHEPPVNLVGVPFYHDLDSYGTFSASGSTTGCEGTCGEIAACITSTWSGSGSLPIVENATGASSFIALGGFDPLHHTLTMSIGAGNEDGIHYSDCGTCFPPTSPCLTGELNWQTDISINEGFNPEPYFTMFMNSAYDVIAGERTPTAGSQPFTYSGYFQGTPTIKLSWPAAVVSFPPDSTAGH